MAVGAILRIWPGRNQKGAGSHTGSVGVKSGSAIVTGAPLVHSSGTIAEAASPATTSMRFIGISKGAQAAADANVAYYEPDQEFEGSLQASGATTTLAQTDLWSTVYLTKDVGGVWYLDRADPGSGGLVCMITGFRSAIGDSDPRVFFKFLRAYQIGV